MFIDAKSVFFEKYAKDSKHIELNQNLTRLAIVLNKNQSNVYIFDYKEIKNYSSFKEKINDKINDKSNNLTEDTRFHNENIKEIKSNEIIVKDNLNKKFNCSKEIIKNDLDLNLLATIKIDKDFIKQIKFISVSINDNKLKSLSNKYEYLLVITDNSLLLYYSCQLKYFNTNITYKKNSSRSISSKSICYDSEKENWILFNKYNLNLGQLNICYLLPNVRNNKNKADKDIVNILPFLGSKNYIENSKETALNKDDHKYNYLLKEYMDYQYDDFFILYAINMEFELHIVKADFNYYHNNNEIEKSTIKVNYISKFIGISLNTTINSMLVTNDSKFIYMFNSLGITIYAIKETKTYNLNSPLKNMVDISKIELVLLVCLDYEEITFYNSINQEEILSHFGKEKFKNNESSLDVSKLLNMIHKPKKNKKFKQNVQSTISLNNEISDKVGKNCENEFNHSLKIEFLKELKRKSEKARINYFANNDKLSNFQIDIERDLDNDEFHDLMQKLKVDNNECFKSKENCNSKQKFNSNDLNNIIEHDNSNIIINDITTLEDYNNFFECSNVYFSNFEKYFVVSFFNIKSNLYYLVLVDNLQLKQNLEEILKNKIKKKNDVLSKQFTEISNISKTLFFNETEAILKCFKIILSSKNRFNPYFSKNIYFKSADKFNQFEVILNDFNKLNIFDKIYQDLNDINSELVKNQQELSLNQIKESKFF